MANNPVGKILQHLQRSAFLGDGAGLSDGQLLERYLHLREDAAFAALVRRHGPMVMGVCRRVLGNDHDAEDAFQASFLVLVRKATSVMPRERVANFLYGVAHTTAVRTRGLIARRRMREKQVAEMPDVEARSQELWDDVRPLLDLELSRLPEKYRVAIVLCDLEDRPIKEAARQLGWPQGTLAGRLARARVMLAKRLARHGLTVSGGALAVMLSQQARSALVAPRLIFGTMEAARLFAAGQAASGLIAAPVAALTEGVLRTMLLTKLKIVTALAVVMAALALTAAGGLYTAAAGDEPEPKRPVADAPFSETKRPAPPDPLLVPKPPVADSAAASAPEEPRDKNDLPTGPMPRQVLVRLEKGSLAVETLDVTYEPITVMPEGKNYAVTSYQAVYVRRTRHYRPDMLKVYDMKGKRIDPKELPKLLKKETVALFASGEQAADPLNLRLFKEGTLLFVFPSMPPPPAVAVPTVAPPTTVAPAPPDGSPVPPPAPAPAAVPYAPTIRLAPRAPAPTREEEYEKERQHFRRVPSSSAPSTNPSESPRGAGRPDAPNP